MYQFLEPVLIYWEEGGWKVGGAFISYMNGIRLHMEVWNLRDEGRSNRLPYVQGAVNCTNCYPINAVAELRMVVPANFILGVCPVCSGGVQYFNITAYSAPVRRWKLQQLV